MPFGDFLGKSNIAISLISADGKRAEINSSLQKAALRFLGVPHTDMRTRARLIMQEMKRDDGQNILDAGCGPGFYSITLSKKKRKVMGIDLDKSKIKEAKKISESLGIKNVKFVQGDLRKTSFKKNSFDVIISSDVLEHIQEDKKVMGEFSRIIKKGGRLILTFPTDNKKNEEVMDLFGHVRPGYKRDEFLRLAEKNGLILEKEKTYVHFFGKVSWKINEILLKVPLALGVLFYPVYLLTFLDIFKIGEPNGLFFVLRKV